MAKKDKDKTDKPAVRVGRREQKSGHGSLTKSGKVRAQTLKVEKTSQKKSKNPIITNRSKFRRMDYKEKHKDERKLYET